MARAKHQARTALLAGPAGTYEQEESTHVRPCAARACVLGLVCPVLCLPPLVPLRAPRYLPAHCLLIAGAAMPAGAEVTDAQLQAAEEAERALLASMAEVR